MTQNHKISIVCGRFNKKVVDQPLSGCVDTLKKAGYSDEQLQIEWVPGSFELPLAAQLAGMQNDVSAVITLGAIIRGDTPHFDFICNACAQGIAAVGLELEMPIVFGVLTTDNTDQAHARCGISGPNLGIDYANVALEMIAFCDKMAVD